MPSPSESLRLVAQLRQAADPLRREALAAAYQRYFLRLIALLRRRLPAYLCRRVEAADLAQSAWAASCAAWTRTASTWRAAAAFGRCSRASRSASTTTWSKQPI